MASHRVQSGQTVEICATCSGVFEAGPEVPVRAPWKSRNHGRLQAPDFLGDSRRLAGRFWSRIIYMSFAVLLGKAAAGATFAF